LPAERGGENLLRLGVWRILYIAQIEHRRISVYARSAN
jgi:hypothetical protein